jgi:sensor domain CHASE-containing protein
MSMNQQISATNQAATMEHMVSSGVIPLNGGDGGFGADAATGGASGIRYQNLDVDQLVERYWPGSY